MSDLPAFDELHVVSDLHMGGRAGAQILRETVRLANFIGRLAAQRPQGQLALVLNGDVFDTLAEDVAGYVAVDDARSTVERIMKDASFVPIWDALAAFVKRPGRTLVIVIGNHDIEMAFPPVQRLLLARLAGDDLTARARITISAAGAGFTCRVGGSRVYCIHGNEVDPWNYNRYEDLARVSRRMNAGQTLTQDEWQPNAGTRMVKEVMNTVKRTYAWIDLLKPETSAAVGTLLVLDPSQAKKIQQMFGVVGERKRGDAQVDARLSADAAAVSGRAGAALPPTPTPPLEQMLGPALRQGLGERTEDMLLQAEQNYKKGAASAGANTHAAGTALTARTDSTLGTSQLIVDRLTGWLTGITQAEALRRALCDWLKDDQSFNAGHPDDTFNQVKESVGPAIDFIVTGHTHLERAIDMGQGRFYFNTGTWIRLMRFTPEMLASEAAFAEVYKVLADGRMKAIDAATFGGEPLVLDRTSAVSICAGADGVTGALLHVVGDGTGEPDVVKSFKRP